MRQLATLFLRHIKVNRISVDDITNHNFNQFFLSCISTHRIAENVVIETENYSTRKVCILANDRMCEKMTSFV